MPGRQQRRGTEAYDRYVQFSQVPMTALAFLMPVRRHARRLARLPGRLPGRAGVT